MAAISVTGGAGSSKLAVMRSTSAPPTRLDTAFRGAPYAGHAELAADHQVLTANHAGLCAHRSDIGAWLDDEARDPAENLALLGHARPSLARSTAVHDEKGGGERAKRVSPVIPVASPYREPAPRPAPARGKREEPFVLPVGTALAPEIGRAHV